LPPSPAQRGKVRKGVFKIRKTNGFLPPPRKADGLTPPPLRGRGSRRKAAGESVISSRIIARKTHYIYCGD